MKRFYEKAEARAIDDGFEIALDGRPVNTPARALLRIPTEGLARAIAAEWNAQGDKVKPASMPLTGLANAALDRVAKDHDGFVRGLAVFGETDLLCYRADSPSGLIDRQEELWDPLLAWAQARYGVAFQLVHGIMHRHQPKATVERLREAVESRDSFELAALSPLVTLSGSLVIALALAERQIGVDAAWTAASVDDDWQSEKWGMDAEAADRLERRRQEFVAAYTFLTLVDPSG